MDRKNLIKAVAAAAAGGKVDRLRGLMLTKAEVREIREQSPALSAEVLRTLNACCTFDTSKLS